MKDKWYIKLLNLLKLETTTPHGRVNLAGVLILAIFGMVYSASDVVRHLISASEDIIKSVVLQQDIYHEYETPNVIAAMIPVLIGFVLCLLFLWLHEKNKDDTIAKIEDEK